MCAGSQPRVDDELGDLLFTVANLARHLGVDPESAARAASTKFERRFRELERRASAGGSSVDALDSTALDDLWRTVKAEEE